MTADPAVQSEGPEPGAGKRFLDLARRLVAVPKEEVDRQRHDEEESPQPE